MSYQHALYEKRGHVAYVTLNRPERMNALNRHSHVELKEIFDRSFLPPLAERPTKVIGS